MTYKNLQTKNYLPEGAKVITSTWAYEKKSNGINHGRLNVKGFEQIAEKHLIQLQLLPQ